MRSSTAFLLATGTCAAGFLAAWALFRPTRDRSLTALAEQDTHILKPHPEIEVPRLGSDVEQSSTRSIIIPAGSAPHAERAPNIDPQKHETSHIPDPRTLPELTIEQMKAKQIAVSKYLSEKAMPFLKQRLDDGLSERVTEEPPVSALLADQRNFIYAERSVAGIPGRFRTKLPREEYPELYEIKDDLIRLEARIVEAAIVEATAAISK